MATMTTEHDEQERLLEQARNMAVQLDAELAVVASLVRAANERGQIMHVLVGHDHEGRNHECPSCQLVAWAATA